MKCDASLMGNLNVVFILKEKEYVAELADVLYALDPVDNILAPSVEIEGESWDRL